MSQSNRKVRDLIRVGVFTALLIVVEFAIACTIGYVPLLMITAMPCILGIASGIINVVMLSGMKMKGGLFISNVLFGLFMINMAPYGFMFFICVIGGLAGELIKNLLGHETFQGQTVGICTVLLFSSIGTFAPFIFMKEAYLELYANNTSGTLYVVEYGIDHVTIPWALAVTAAALGCTVLGCFWGKRIRERHLTQKSEQQGE